MVEVNDKDLLAIFDGHQAYDVADMVKQYFRELPESLLTNKMSETFVAIFQRKYSLGLILIMFSRLLMAMITFYF